MTNTKGKRRGTRYMFSRPFRQRGVLPLAAYMQIYKKGGIVDIKGMGTVQKGMPHNVTLARLEESTMSPSMRWALLLNKLRARFLPRELMYKLSILNTQRVEIASWNVCRKMIKKRRKPKRKVPRSNWSISLLHPEKHTLWELMERSLSCWNPSPLNSWHDKCKINKWINK